MTPEKQLNINLIKLDKPSPGPGISNVELLQGEVVEPYVPTPLSTTSTPFTTPTTPEKPSLSTPFPTPTTEVDHNEFGAKDDVVLEAPDT